MPAVVLAGSRPAVVHQLWAVWLAVVQHAAAAVPAADGPWYGYPPWAVVLVGTVVAALALWVLSKLIKWLLILAIVAVVVAGILLAVKLYLGGT